MSKVNRKRKEYINNIFTKYGMDAIKQFLAGKNELTYFLKIRDKYVEKKLSSLIKGSLKEQYNISAWVRVEYIPQTQVTRVSFYKN